MDETIEIRDLLVAISRMPEGRRVRSDAVWYESQKEHWIGWLLDYKGPGAYGRKRHDVCDARRVYNRLVCPGMLLYLAKGSGVSAKLIREASTAERRAGPTLMAKCKAVRAYLPWRVVLQALLRSGYLPARAAR
jgi:hypothetical protein